MTSGADTENRYFWINTNLSRWPEDNSQLFYPRETVTGDERREQAAFRCARDGDLVVVFRMMPVRRVVAKARIVRGLHTESKEGYDGAVEGISIEGVSLLEGPTWDDIKSDPIIRDAAPIVSRNAISFTEITREEFDRIVAL